MPTLSALRSARPALRATALAALVVAMLQPAALATAATPTPPDVVFILLDTTRADRLSAWGNPRRTTPALDELAASGVRFARHFANSHATRPSMPQLLSGRYYQPNVLREFRPRTHPRDWPFAADDATLALLPEILRTAGYHLLAVSAHPWVSRDSRFGAPFDVFEEPEVPAQRGHADVGTLVDLALARWRERPRDRPTLLYIHVMDAHIPRHVAPGELRFGAEDPVARARFDDAGEPSMHDPSRDWDRSDARAFTPADVAFFTAVYDTMLARIDDAVARLLQGLRSEDPTFERTVVVVTADHGEELGDHGRISHEASLDDAVQHIPWIMAGGGIPPGQTAWGVTENVDVLPTVLDSIGIVPPAEVVFDGRSVLREGRVCATCLRVAPVYAWEDYRGIRLGHRRLLRESKPTSFTARCDAARRLLDETRRESLEAPVVARTAATMLARRLDAPDRRHRSTRWNTADRAFTVLPPFWGTGGATDLVCVAAGPDTPRTAFAEDGWIWTGRGVTVFSGAERTDPLSLLLDVPDGEYDVTLGVRTLPAPPRFFGYDRWLRKRVRRREPKERVPLGEATAENGILAITIPASLAVGRHVLAVHLAPSGVIEATPDGRDADPGLRDRLRALGYVE